MLGTQKGSKPVPGTQGSPRGVLAIIAEEFSLKNKNQLLPLD